MDLTNLDQELTEDSGATKRDLVDYLDAVADRMLPVLADRPLTVLRALRGRAPFMQKNVPKYTPDWVRTVGIWAEASKREIHYALCDDRRTLLWLANQRAIEYHPALGLADNIYRPTHLILDLDPPADADFSAVVAVANLVRRALTDSGLSGAVKTSGSRGVHIFVPIDEVPDLIKQACVRREEGGEAAELEVEDRIGLDLVDLEGGKRRVGLGGQRRLLAEVEEGLAAVGELDGHDPGAWRRRRSAAPAPAPRARRRHGLLVREPHRRPPDLRHPPRMLADRRAV